ncbi:MAG: HNH endonuclease, partial [Anaerolineales bacterium]|nr:HNH endonuclease [Anaerolineales bacterium]
MKLAEAARQVCMLISEDIERFNLASRLDPSSPDGDEAKFTLDSKTARIVNPFDGHYAKINLGWLKDSVDKPSIKGTEFHWYVFPLFHGSKNKVTAYYICDYMQMREWVRDFGAPLGNPHDDHDMWRAEVILEGEGPYGRGYLRWGDEPVEERRPGRSFNLRNIREILQPQAERGLFAELEEYGLSKQDLRDADGAALGELIHYAHTYRHLGPTEKTAVIQSRVGQGRFRRYLIDYWGGCAVTGANKIDLLKASHIKPWKVSSNKERLDVYNGLLLTPNLDSVFDQGFISFTQLGSILISEELTVE